MIELATLARCKHLYLEYRTARYLMVHPGSEEHQARQYAKVAWNRKMKKWREQGLV